MSLLRNMYEDAGAMRFRGGPDPCLAIGQKGRTFYAPAKFTTPWTEAIPDRTPRTRPPYVMPYKDPRIAFRRWPQPEAD